MHELRQPCHSLQNPTKTHEHTSNRTAYDAHTTLCSRGAAPPTAPVTLAAAGLALKSCRRRSNATRSSARSVSPMSWSFKSAHQTRHPSTAYTRGETHEKSLAARSRRAQFERRTRTRAANDSIKLRCGAVDLWQHMDLLHGLAQQRLQLAHDGLGGGHGAVVRCRTSVTLSTDHPSATNTSDTASFFPL